ncbi:MAG: DNA-deoxyinosine glycosylase [Methanomassiliicoccales archaeon]
MVIPDDAGREHRVGLPPIVGNAPRVLVLGTIPSVKSSSKGQYYGNPLNHFWRLMAEVLYEDMPLDYRERCQVLTDNGIAVWDVLSECDIKGSGDNTIVNPVPNDLIKLLRENQSIRQIFINGKTAYKFYQKFHEGAFKGKVTVLPSSSPANTIKWEARLKEWATIGEALRS